MALFDSSAPIRDLLSNVWSATMVLPMLALIVIVGLAGYLIYSGIFHRVTVDTKPAPFGELVIAYKTGKGAYKNTASIFGQAHALLPGHLCIGIYYDDPESVPEAELRYAVGLVLAADDKEPDPAELDLMLENGYKVAVLPKQQFAVVSSFPLNTSLSLFIAIFR